MALSTPEWIKQDSALLAQYLAGAVDEATFVTLRAALADQLALGTPLSAALRADHAITSLNQTIQKWIMVSGVVRLRGVLNDVSELPAFGEPGDSYLIGQNLHVWDGATFTSRELRGPMGTKVQLHRNATHIQWRYEDDADWTDLAAIADFKGDQGDSAFIVWRDQSGNPTATVQDYLDWIANAQTDEVVAAITPLMGRAELAATKAETAQGKSEADAIAAAASADAADGFAMATAADVTAADAARVASEAASQSAQDADAAAGLKLAAVETARAEAIAAKDAGVAARDASVAAKNDSEAAATTATNKAAESATSAAASASSEEGANTARTASEAAQAAAELARDEAQAIAGGNFQPSDPTLTAMASQTWTSGKTVFAMTAQDVFVPLAVGNDNDTDLLDRLSADGRFRLKSVELTVAEVTGLQGALDAKATPADIQAAIDALVAGAPGALDTLYEIAEKFAADDDAMAALLVTVGEKAGQDAVDALTARIAALEAVKPVLTVNGTAPDEAGNIIVQTGDVAPSEVALTRSNGVLTTVTETVDGDPRVTTLTRSNGVLTQTVTTYRGKTTTNTFNRTNGRLTGVTTTEA